MRSYRSWKYPFSAALTSRCNSASTGISIRSSRSRRHGAASRWGDESAQREVAFLSNEKNGEDQCWLAALHLNCFGLAAAATGAHGSFCLSAATAHRYIIVSSGGITLALFHFDAIGKQRDPATHSAIARPLDLSFEALQTDLLDDCSGVLAFCGEVDFADGGINN
jgi:hypothetical protein